MHPRIQDGSMAEPILSAISLVLLAGGTGTRMGAGLPKQFRQLREKPLALYSFELFDHLLEVDEIIVVCDPLYRSLFTSSKKPISFAVPGHRRQDSVYQGLLATSEKSQFISVHDAARPFIEKDSVLSVFREAHLTGAAALAIPVANTIKQADEHGRVICTPPRQALWEVQTPQVIRRDLFLKAYAHAKSRGLEATDDVSLIEAMGEPVSLVKSSSRNFKITTPLDWTIAEHLIPLPPQGHPKGL